MKKENTLKFALFLFCICFSVKSYCQCSATFVDTAGSNGNVTFYSIIADTSKHPYCFWTFGDGNDTAGINAAHTYLYNYTYMVCLTVYDSTCYDSACHVVQVTNASQIPSCSGNAAFTATANGTLTDFTNSSGNWEIVDFGDGSSSQSSGSNSIFHQYALNGTYQVTALAYTNAGNISFTCDTSIQSITVANVSCKAAFSMYADTSNYQFYCSDQSLSAANRKWYINDTLVASNVINFNSPTLPPGTYNVCLAINGPGGCQDSTCQSITLNYTVPCTNVTFSYNPVSSECNTYQFIADTTGSTINSINWFLNGDSAGSQTTDTIALDFSSANNIVSQSVTVYTQGPGCQSAQSFSFTNPADFYVDLDTSGSAHTWYAYPQNTSDVKSQVWDFGDGTSSALPYPTHTYASVGYYNVCHTDTLTDLCAYTYCINQYFFRTTQTGGISYFVVIPPLGIQEQKKSPTLLKVYPNPSSGLVNFNFENAPNEDTFLKIYNSTGILVKSATLKNGLTTYSLSTTGLATGIYFYEITGNEGSNIHGKIIVAD